MTAQCREKLTYKGEAFSMATEPLCNYLKNRKEIKFVAPSTACWRGYIGEWIIEDYKLYLVNINAYIEGYNEVGLDFLFPNKTRVFAEWFSGEIRIPHGKMLEYVHQGYASLFEKELSLILENGVLVNETEKDNQEMYNNMDVKEKEKWRTNAVIESLFGVSLNKKTKKSFWKSLFGK